MIGRFFIEYFTNHDQKGDVTKNQIKERKSNNLWSKKIGQSSTSEGALIRTFRPLFAIFFCFQPNVLFGLSIFGQSLEQAFFGKFSPTFFYIWPFLSEIYWVLNCNIRPNVKKAENSKGRRIYSPKIKRPKVMLDRKLKGRMTRKVI